MHNIAIIVLVAVVAIAIVAAVWYVERRRSRRLRGHFGPEYERTLRQFGDRRSAESELERRARRIEKYHIHGISLEDKRRFADAWRIEQGRFVDEPEQAVMRAHDLVGELMRARGYPVSAEFEENAADLSVGHPVVVEHYRQACVIATRREHGQANTEDLRSAMLHYRELFEELLQMPVIEGQEQRPQETIR
jgi:hypothetical protein